MAAEFVHLHVHTQYSFLDGAVRIGGLARRAKEAGMCAVAITDHGNMFGALQLHKYCGKSGLMPIIGCEINVARAVQGRESKHLPIDHLVLLARNNQGYKNLLSIVSRGHVEPASDLGPSVTWETVQAQSAGLIALTGCMGGMVAQQVLEYGEQAGLASLDRLRGSFEKGHLFVELQDHGLVEQPVLNRILVDTARKLELPLVATNDVHYLSREDADAQIYLSCAHSGRTYTQAKGMHHGSSEMYFKTAEEMETRFHELPEALSSTLAIAEMCRDLKLELGKPMLPELQGAGGVRHAGDTSGTWPRRDSGRGSPSSRRSARMVDQEAYWKQPRDRSWTSSSRWASRDTSSSSGTSSGTQRSNGIPVGPGRGSGAGSIVAYAMRITDLDPIPYSLLFERFLNPERVSMPDFDVDFCMDRRDEVIEYVAEKYGRESVGQIATFHELKARSVIKDVARAMGLPANEAQQMASLIPPNPKVQGQMYTIPESARGRAEARGALKDDAVAREPHRSAQQARRPHASRRQARRRRRHQQGPALGPRALLRQRRQARHAVLQGRRRAGRPRQVRLPRAQDADRHRHRGASLVNARPDRRRRDSSIVAKVPLDDKLTYALLQTRRDDRRVPARVDGHAAALQGLSSRRVRGHRRRGRALPARAARHRHGEGLRRLQARAQADRRPAPALSTTSWRPRTASSSTRSRSCRSRRSWPATRSAAPTCSAAPWARRSPRRWPSRRRSSSRARARRASAHEDAERIFGLLEYFAGYGFNKSHSAAYALLTYQTAYLKAHYPVEFLCALLTADKSKIEKVVRIIAEGRAMGVTILPPDINDSRTDFTVVYASPGGDYRASRGSKIKDAYQPQIRFGLGAVRGLGESALMSVFEARDAGGPFHDLFDFAERVDSRRVNKATLESLIQCGAFDTTLAARGISRARAFAAVDRALERSRSASKDRERGQTTLFSVFGAQTSTGENSKLEEYPQAEPWDLRDTLMREKQSLGFYVSGHPLDRYGKDLRRFEIIPTADLPTQNQWARVRVAGVAEGYRERVFKGSRVAFFELLDEGGRVDVKIGEKKVDAFAPLLASGEPLLVEGKVSFPMAAEDEVEEEGPRKPTLFLDEAKPLAAAILGETRSIALRLGVDRVRPEQMHTLRQVLESSPGNCPVSVVVDMADGAQAHLAVGSALRVAPSDGLLAGLERLFGENIAELKS